MKPTPKQRSAFRKVKRMMRVGKTPFMAELGLNVFRAEDVSQWGRLVRERYMARSRNPPQGNSAG